MDAHSWDQRYASSDMVWSAEPNQFFAAEAATLPPGRALDLGTGEGRNAMWLAAQGWDVTAVDFSAVAIEKARTIAEKRGAHVTWIVDDLATYMPEASGFDLVALVYIHLPRAERRLVVERAAAAVAPNGTLLVIGHDSSNLTNGFGGPHDPDVLFTSEDIVADIGGILQIVRAERVQRPTATRPLSTPSFARFVDSGTPSTVSRRLPACARP
jgi:SAM-dependent methyltransferase